MNKLGIVINTPRSGIAEELINQGYTPILIYDSSKDVESIKANPNIKNYALSIPMDFRHAKQELKVLQRFVVSPESITIALEDGYTQFAAMIAEFLQLDQHKAFPVELARLCSNKLLQRRLFSKTYPEITVPFKKIRTFHGAYTFARKHGYPVVVKPASLAGSKLISVCHDLESLVRNVSYAIEFSEKIYLQNKVYKKASLMIEDFIHGKLYSVDSYVDKNGNVTHTPPCREFEAPELGLHAFTGLPVTGYLEDYTPEEEQRMYDTIQKAIKSVGITSNIVHSEIKMDHKSCKIIEINARGGGRRIEMLKIAYGTDHAKHIIEAMSGKKVTYKPSKIKQHVVHVNYLAQTPGVLESVDGLDTISDMPELVGIYALAKPGKLVGPANYGYPRLCSFVFSGQDADVLLERAKSVFEIVKPAISPIEITW